MLGKDNLEKIVEVICKHKTNLKKFGNVSDIIASWVAKYAL